MKRGDGRWERRSTRARRCGDRRTRRGCRSRSSEWCLSSVAGVALAGLALGAAGASGQAVAQDASAEDVAASAAGAAATAPAAEVPAGTEPAAAPGVDVIQLANEGYLLRSGDTAVLIDAFVAEPYSIYAALPPEVHADMVAGRPPFDGIDLALVSHAHRDHFQPESAAAFLVQHPATLLATSPQVLEALASASSPAEADREGAPRAVTREVLPEPGQTLLLDHAGVYVEVLRLSHGSGRFASIQNLGHLVTIDGVTVAHLGDAEIGEEIFAPYALAERGIDVALVPYWYLVSAPGRRLVARHFPEAQIIATHVPPEELDAVRRGLAASHPDAVLLREPLDSRRFGATPEEKAARER